MSEENHNSSRKVIKKSHKSENVSANNNHKEEETKTKKFELDRSFQIIHNDGLEKLTKSRTNLEKFCWVLLIIFVTCIAAYEIFKAVTDYYNSPTVTSYKIVSRKEMSFPQIYLCPASSVRRSYLLHGGRSRVNRAIELGNHLFMKENAHIRKAGSKSKKLKERSISVSENGFFDQPSVYSSSLMTEMARRTARSANLQSNNSVVHFGIENHTNLIPNISPDSSEFLNHTFMTMGVDQADLFQACLFRSFFLNQVQCREIVRAVLDPIYGKCYLVDVGEFRKQGTPAQGLTLILNLKTQEYPHNETLTPKFTGLVVSVAQKYDPSGFEQILIPNNSYTKVDIHGQHLKFIKVDSGPSRQMCNTADDFPFKYLNANYSQASCYLECHLRTAINRCNCLLTMDSIFYNEDALKNGKFCNLRQAIECIEPNVDNSNEAQDEIQLCKDQCYIPCESWRYNTRVSYMPLNVRAFPKFPPNSTIDDFVYLQIAFPFLEYEEFLQDWSMTVADMISTIGGHIGLWLGASIVTIIQVPIVLFSLSGFKFYTKSTPLIKKVNRSFSQAYILGKT